jgi:hypothetical protein
MVTKFADGKLVVYVHVKYKQSLNLGISALVSAEVFAINCMFSETHNVPTPPPLSERQAELHPSVPVVAEGVSKISALGRAARLARRNRLQIFPG